MKKTSVLIFLFSLCINCFAGWWYSGDDLNWEYQPALSFSDATNAVASLSGQKDVFWGDSVASTGPWIDLYWDGIEVVGYAVGSDTQTVWSNVVFDNYSEAYAAAFSALGSNPDFSGAFNEPVFLGKRLAKGHKK